MKKSKWIILFLLVFLAAGCDLFDPARNVYESHILDIIDYLQRMEYEVRVNNIGDDPPESATLWQKESSIREDNIKLEYSNLSITDLAYDATVTYFESLCQSPVFSISGEMEFSYNASDNEHKVISGTFTIKDSDPQKMPITELTLEIDLVQSWASGTATANGKEFILEEDSIR